MRSDQTIKYLALCSILLLAAVMFGCSGDNGTNANAFGTVSGKVVDTYGNNVAGATVATSINSDAYTATTDANGAYAVTLASGPRTFSFTAPGYTSYSQSIEAVPGKTATLNVTLNPTGPAAVTAARTDSGTVLPGGQIALSAKVFKFDPALANQTPTYSWSVVSGPAVTFSDANSATPTVTMASAAAFKKYLVEMAAPLYKPVADEPAVPITRYQVVPFSYEQAISQGNTTKLKVTATVGGKTYTSIVSVAAKIPAVPSNGLQNVPIKQPVVLQGQIPFKDANGNLLFTPKATWNWSVAGPGGAVAVNDATTAYPDFTPATSGTYVVSEGGVPVLNVYAGTYAGMMSAAATPDAACNGCHNDKVTSWLQTGHKDVLYSGIKEPLPDGHYAMTCTPCHTVGNGAAGSNGFVDAAAAEGLTNFTRLQGDLNAEADFWKSNPQSAKLAGIQCENCHGPQANSGQHQISNTVSPDLGNSRVSYSASVCATCHARAPKHGRFSQWKTSAHAAYASVTFNSNPDGTLSAACACCHTAQGFKAYAKILPTANGNRALTVLPASLTVNNAEPITCSTCHVSHSEGKSIAAEVGNTFQDVNSANLAKVGPDPGSTYMLPSGFAANGVGKGALCIACHNSRQGISGGAPFLHEDGDVKFGTLASYGAPHEAAQGDVLMGRNAYWMGTGRYNSPQTRSKHSYIADTCVTCHMELTTLDLALSEPGQTRHDFKASLDVCNKCHTAYSAESVQTTFDAKLAAIKATVGNAILQVKYDNVIPVGTSATLVANRSGMVDVTSGAVTRRWFINNKTGQDAFLADPNNGGALVQGCTDNGDGTANCTGFLANATVTFNPNATVTAAGVNDVIAKALWNTVLVQDDASRGVHNPAFTFEMLDNTYVHVSTWAH